MGFAPIRDAFHVSADVNIRFNHWQTVVTHENAKDLFTKSGNNTKYSAEDYLNYFLNL